MSQPNNSVNEEVFRIYRELPSSQGELFLTRAASYLKEVKNATIETVREFHKIWNEAVRRDHRDRAALGDDY